VEKQTVRDCKLQKQHNDTEKRGTKSNGYGAVQKNKKGLQLWLN
jgi:hypothetical protein